MDDNDNKYITYKNGNNDEIDGIVISEEYEKLENEVEKLRVELSMILLEKDELQYVICKNIEMQYMLKIGNLEYKLYQAQCNALRLKRKIELIQAKKNRQEKIDLTIIEEMLNKEFEEYRRKLEEQINKMNDALERNKGRELSDEETKELKKLYRKIVKALHPDLNPDITDAQLRLFNNAVNAYKSGNLEDLRIIYEMIDDNVLPPQEIDVMSYLGEEKNRLQDLIKAIRRSIDKIKNEYPYILKELIEDEDKLKEKKREYEEAIAQYDEIIVSCKEKIKDMLECDYGRYS